MYPKRLAGVWNHQTQVVANSRIEYIGLADSTAVFVGPAAIVAEANDAYKCLSGFRPSAK